MSADLYSTALSIVEASIVGEPRSQQQIIGPSEVGASCLHCLAAKLSGWQKRDEAAWLPWIGSSIHARLEEVFSPLKGWLTETRVSVGMIGDQEISGTADLFHIESGTCIDFKTVGAATLRKAKGGPSAQYLVQANLYSTGFLRAGYDVNKVVIWYMPRNDISLRRGIWWEDNYNPLIALDALDRATALIEKLQSFPTPEARDAYITTLPRDADCYDCRKFPDAPTKAPHDSLHSLLGM